MRLDNQLWSTGNVGGSVVYVLVDEVVHRYCGVVWCHRRETRSSGEGQVSPEQGLTGLRPPFRLGCWASWTALLLLPETVAEVFCSLSGVESAESSDSSRGGLGLLSMDISSAIPQGHGAGPLR